ncbi:MAG: ABC transporter substrate-binding protein [Hyphomicrobiales bacterium]
MCIIHVFRLSRRGVILGLLAAALVKGSAAAQTSVKFTLDWKFEGPAAPFLVAVDRGYFTAEKLDVTIEPGNGSLEPINRVASGAYDIGFGDINTLIKFRDRKRGAPLKAVFMVYNKPPSAIVARKSRGITTPKDLEGKKLGAPAGDAAFAEWPIFVKTTGIDARKVTIVTIGFTVREPILAGGQVDAITGFSFSSYFTLKDSGVPLDDIVVMLMGDYGLKLYSNAIIVNAKFAAENPEAVRGFLRAFLKGLKDTVASPTRAIESVLRRNEVAKKEVELERLRMAIRDNILTPEVQTNGYGGVDVTRFEQAIDQIGLAHKFKAKPTVADVFDPSFLPPAGERRVR